MASNTFADDNAIDQHIGERIKLRRNLLGMSQAALGTATGLTYQQIQKYERGANRVSGSKLWRIAQTLDVPVAFFFDGLEEPADAPETEDTDQVLHDTGAGTATKTGQVLGLIRDFDQLPEKLQRQIRKLIKAVAWRQGHSNTVGEQDDLE